jgi:creatinine amidohydrolase
MGYSIFDETMVDMTWPEIEKAASEGAIVLLPVGIIEEHGPHMGEAVDIYIAYLVSVLAKHRLESDGIKTLIAPPQYWGISEGTATFGGTFSVREETMKALIYDIITSLHGWGFNKVFTVNGHGDISHCLAIIDAIKDARRDTGIDARYISSDSAIHRLRLTGSEDYILIQPTPPFTGSPEKYVDIHAGSLETGIMLKYFPEQVDAALAKKLPRSKVTFDDLKDLGKSDAVTRKLIPNGYFGNPAGYDTKVAEKYIKDGAKSTADCIEGYLKSK